MSGQSIMDHFKRRFIEGESTPEHILAALPVWPAGGPDAAGADGTGSDSMTIAEKPTGPGYLDDLKRGDIDGLRQRYMGDWSKIGSEQVPPDLAMCNRCRMVVGSHRQKWGRECECDIPPAMRYRGAIGAQSGA